MASVSSQEYKVPDKLVAETPTLLKKTSSIRGTAGLKGKLLIKELAIQKTKSTNKLSYMDPPVSPRLASPPAPPPQAAEPFVIPDAVLTSDD